MILNKDIFDTVIDGKECTCLTIGTKDVEIPPSLVQTRREPSYIISGDEVTPWYWNGFATVDDRRCFVFDRMKLTPLCEIAYSRRKDALKLLIKVAEALEKLDNRFLKLSSGVISLWRIYFTENDDVLVLSNEMEYILQTMATPEERFMEFNSQVNPLLHPAFTLINQLTSLMYFAAACHLPYSDSQTRENKYRPIPLSVVKKFACPDLDDDVISYVDQVMNLKMSKQKEFSGNMAPQKALGFFVENTENLNWNLDNREDFDFKAELDRQTDLRAMIEKREKGEKRSVFWRKKGGIVTIIAVVVITIVCIAYNMISRALEPPYTVGMEPEEIILSYFQGHNDLDIEKVTEPFRKVKDCPIEMEVTSMFVNRQTRIGYEGRSPFIDVVKWNDEGRPAILQDYVIYGNDDVEIEKIDDVTFRVTNDFYTPFTSGDSDEDLIPEESILGSVYVYEQEQIFHFGWNDRGWWEITQVDPVSMVEKEVIHPEMISRTEMQEAVNTLQSEQESQEAAAQD